MPDVQFKLLALHGKDLFSCDLPQLSITMAGVWFVSLARYEYKIVSLPFLSKLQRGGGSFPMSHLGGGLFGVQ